MSRRCSHHPNQEYCDDTCEDTCDDTCYDYEESSEEELCPVEDEGKFCIIKVKGPRGPRGPRGCKGEKGCPGDQGMQGKRGPPGPKGDCGKEGKCGKKGCPGDTGPQGPCGKRGPPGPKGCKGDRGCPGEKGDTGPPGPTGMKGEKGDRGDLGLTGPIGRDGEKGDQGDQGDQGEIGPMGHTGPLGLRGHTGEKGERGDTGHTGPPRDPNRKELIIWVAPPANHNSTHFHLEPSSAEPDFTFAPLNLLSQMLISGFQIHHPPNGTHSNEILKFQYHIPLLETDPNPEMIFNVHFFTHETKSTDSVTGENVVLRVYIAKYEHGNKGATQSFPSVQGDGTYKEGSTIVTNVDSDSTCNRYYKGKITVNISAKAGETVIGAITREDNAGGETDTFGSLAGDGSIYITSIGYEYC